MKNNLKLFNYTGATRLGGVLNIWTGIFNIQHSYPYSTNVATSTCSSEPLFFNRIKLATSDFTSSSPEWCKEKKIEILKHGSPALFDDLSKLKENGYFARSTNSFKEMEGMKMPLSFDSLRKKAGIYMITNKVTKKVYIGMSSDLKTRFYNYLDLKRLGEKNHLRIHKALLKYGADKFSVAILEFLDKPTFEQLKRREDFFIQIFNPQYNIARSHFNLEKTRGGYHTFKTTLVIPPKVKNLIQKCLNPKLLNWHLLTFEFFPNRAYYLFTAWTPKGSVSVNSSGWFQGIITKQSGYDLRERKKTPNLDYDIIKPLHMDLDIKKLAEFFPEMQMSLIKQNMKDKLKALKKKSTIKTKS